MKNKEIITNDSPIEIRHQRVLNLVRSYLQQHKIKYSESMCDDTSSVYFYIDAGGHNCKLRVANHPDKCTDANWSKKGYVSEIRSDNPSFPFNKNGIKFVGIIIENARRKSRVYADYKMFDKI